MIDVLQAEYTYFSKELNALTTEEVAIIKFGDGVALGKALILMNSGDFRVVGVGALKLHMSDENVVE